MVAAVIVGFGVTWIALVVGFVLARRRDKEQTKLLTIVDSRCAVLTLRVERWMKNATTLGAHPAAQPIARIDPRREPE